MGRLFELIEAHRSSHEPYPPSYSRIAEQVGVARQTLLNWRDPTGWIRREHLEALAEVLGVPYIRLLDAMLEDIGYIPKRPPTQGGGQQAERPTGS